MRNEPWIPLPTGLQHGPFAVLDRVLTWAVVGGLLAMALIIFAQVVSRYALNQPTSWSEELSISLFVWITMLSIPLGLRRGEHLTLDIISKRLSAGWAKALAIGIAVLNVLLFGALIYLTFKLLPAADRQILAGIAGGLGVPAKVSWVYFAVIVGSFFSVVFTIERVALFIRGRLSALSVDADQLIIEELSQIGDLPAVDPQGPSKKTER